MAEWLKRQTRIRASDLDHLFLYEGAGSNPAGVVGFAPFFIKLKRANNFPLLEHNGRSPNTTATAWNFVAKTLRCITTMDSVLATKVR